MVVEPQIHQAELELQDQELRRLQLLVEQSRNRHIDSYDSVPVGYFTLDREGFILDANLTGASLLGTERSSLIGKPFSRFVDKGSLDTFYSHNQQVFESETKHRCEVKVYRSDGAFFDARLETLVTRDAGECPSKCHMVISDITNIKEAARDLRDQKEHYRGVFDNAGVGILLLDRDGNILQMNQALLSMLGYIEEDIQGLPLADITHPNDREISDSNLKSHIEGEKGSHRFEKRYLRKDGSFIWGDVSTTSILDANAKPAKIIAVIADITKHKLAEQELLEASNQWQRTFDSVPDLISILSKDQKIVRVNKVMAEALSLSPEECVGQPCYNLVHGTDGPPSLCPYAKMLLLGKAQSAEIQEPHLRGEYNITVSPILDQDDEIWGGVHIARYISERKQGERELWRYKENLEEMVEQRTRDLHESEIRFRDLLEATIDFVWESDPVGVYTFVSPRIKDLLGYAPEEVIGETFPNFMSPKEQNRVSDIFQSIFASRKPFKALESAHTHRDGHEVFLETSGAPVINLYGQFMGYRGVCRDITKRKQAERILQQKTEELERSNNDLEQFAYVAAHDLREPLVAVGAYLKVLERLTKNTLEDIGRKCMAKAISLVLQMDAMLQALLAYSRINLTPVSYELTDCDVCLKDALSNLGLAIMKSGAVVTSDPLPTVKGNAAQIVQVFQNLIGNAIKFRGKGSLKVHIDCKANDSEYKFSVNDNGIGIDPPYLERIFNMFERVKDLSGPSGTGIGLSTCRKIVERHGGRIWVDSKLGKGSTFYFTIPKG